MKAQVASRWRSVALVCGKCSRKLDGGFGASGDVPLAKALRRELGLGKGRKAAAGVVEVKCLGICPRRAVVALDARRPERWLLVRPGTPVVEVASALGLDGRSEHETVPMLAEPVGYVVIEPS